MIRQNTGSLLHFMKSKFNNRAVKLRCNLSIQVQNSPANVVEGANLWVGWTGIAATIFNSKKARKASDEQQNYTFAGVAPWNASISAIVWFKSVFEDLWNEAFVKPSSSVAFLKPQEFIYIRCWNPELSGVWVRVASNPGNFGWDNNTIRALTSPWRDLRFRMFQGCLFPTLRAFPCEISNVHLCESEGLWAFCSCCKPNGPQLAND